MPNTLKAVRTDRELECPDIDAGLRARGVELVTLPEGIGEDALIEAVREVDLLLMCYTPITARVIDAAPRLKGIVKYGVGIDAIDIAAIHAVLNAETLYLIGAHELAAMKPWAFLINVSRGAIVDEAALVMALREQRIGGAALDVFSQEPMHVDHPLAALYEMDNVILFPHLTFYTQEAMARLTEDTLARCD